MQIKAHILANRTQEVPIPIPGTEITQGISWSYTNPTVYASVLNDKPGGAYWSQKSETCTDRMMGWDNWGRDDVLPASIAWHGYNLYGDVNPDDQHQRKFWIWEGRLYNVKGSFTVSGLNTLTPGKYVVVCDHWYGSRENGYWGGDHTKPYGVNSIVNVKNLKTVRQGTHGVVYGETNGLECEYVPNPAIGYSMGVLYGIHIVQKAEIVVEEGDTSKTITYGDSSFALQDFCETKEIWYSPSGDAGTSTRYSEVVGLRPKLYTDGRG